MSAPTPGPWRILDPTSTSLFTIVGRDDSYVGRAALRDDGAHEANAALIAATPDLLAKCKKIVKWLNRLADAAEAAAIDNRFASLREVHLADAKNYRATIADIQTTIAKAEPPHEE